MPEQCENCRAFSLLSSAEYNFVYLLQKVCVVFFLSFRKNFVTGLIYFPDLENKLKTVGRFDLLKYKARLFTAQLCKFAKIIKRTGITLDTQNRNFGQRKIVVFNSRP